MSRVMERLGLTVFLGAVLVAFGVALGGFVMGACGEDDTPVPAKHVTAWAESSGMTGREALCSAKVEQVLVREMRTIGDGRFVDHRRNDYLGALALAAWVGECDPR